MRPWYPSSHVQSVTDFEPGRAVVECGGQSEHRGPGVSAAVRYSPFAHSAHAHACE